MREPGTPIWNELVTPDVERATRFYGDVLGMGVQKMEMAEGWACSRTGTPYFNVTSLDEAVAQAESLGGNVVAPAFDVDGVGRMAFLADPQGAMFAVMQVPTEG